MATDSAASSMSSLSETSSPLSMIVRASPSALRRSANGSLLPVGFSPAANPPASVSSRSAIASTLPSFERSEEHTSELQSLMRNSYAVFCLQKETQKTETDKKQ